MAEQNFKINVNIPLGISIYHSINVEIYFYIYIDCSCVYYCLISSEVFYNDIDHAVRNLRKPAAYAAKYKLPIIVWWTSLTHGNTIKRCNFGECYFTEVRKFQTHPRTKAFMFYGTSFNPRDLPLPRLGKH